MKRLAKGLLLITCLIALAGCTEKGEVLREGKLKAFSQNEVIVEENDGSGVWLLAFSYSNTKETSTKTIYSFYATDTMDKDDEAYRLEEREHGNLYVTEFKKGEDTPRYRVTALGKIGYRIDIFVPEGTVFTKDMGEVIDE